MIKIITDSTIYAKKDEIKELNVKVVPMSYTFNGKILLESFSDRNGNFEPILNSNSKILTSQPNPSLFINAFKEELALGNEVLCITISSRLSGTYASAYMAGRQTENEKVAVFDSKLTAGGLYLLIKEAKKLIDKGLKLNEIAERLKEIREKIVLAFSVDDMTPLRNSGRIGFVRMGVGTILNIKPIMLCKDGAVVFNEAARGSNEVIKKLAEKIPGNAREIVVNYIENKKIAVSLYNVIKEKFPDISVKLLKVGPVLGVHLGSQVIGVSALTE